MRLISARFRRQSVRNVGDGTISVIRDRSGEGIALITSLLLLILMSILGLGMVLSVSSDMLINGYYGNYRSAYYSADAGLNVARNSLANQFKLEASLTPCSYWGTGAPSGCTALPIPCTTTATCQTYANTALAAVISSWGGTSTWGGTSSTTTNSGQAAKSWPGGFNVSSAQSSVSITAVPANPCGTGYTPCAYTLLYTLVSIGRGAGATQSQQVITNEVGSLTLTVTPNSTAGGTGPVTTSFSSFGAFISNFSANSSPLVYGTITGPQFTNGSWNFGSGGSYTFTDPVSQSGPTVSYDFSNGSGYHYVDSANTSATYNSTTIAPNFEQGLQVGLPTAPLPTDDYSQLWAVLDGAGCGEGSNVCGNSSSPDPPAITNANLNANLQNVSGTAYPLGGATTGVYLSYSGVPGSTSNPPVMSGGGIYLEGGANAVTLSTGTDSLGNPTQIYTILQNSTTTTITTNIGANTTTIKSGSTTTVVSGVPANTSGNAQTLLYANGTLGASTYGNGYTGLSGTVQNGVQLTIVAKGDIDITGNVAYLEEPVTLNTADTLIPANNFNEILGLYTQAGNFNLVPSSNGGNLEIDAAMAAIGSGCATATSSCGLETPGNSVGTLTIVGGRIEGNAHGVSMDTSNTYYDRRFLTPGFAPPWFPTTTVNSAVIPPVALAPTPTITFSRLNWSTSPQ